MISVSLAKWKLFLNENSPKSATITLSLLALNGNRIIGEAALISNPSCIGLCCKLFFESDGFIFRSTG